ncbi:hypothetical protein [Burkholderia contaminans]|uniref:hypothetical protein n=1 Tax=Burkholderia contaminans TaxID=488447 RepID=UPI001452E784|nr:hypothetical protein [Burkholderia contaminans]VWD15604.1 hypothetical protein BCO18442_03515 [Burkholderia contaminans]
MQATRAMKAEIIQKRISTARSTVQRAEPCNLCYLFALAGLYLLGSAIAPPIGG